MYLANAFSLNMIPPALDRGVVRFRRIDVEEVREIFRKNPLESAVGHVDLARIVSQDLGMEVPVHRRSIYLHPECWRQSMIVAQYRGPRLPEGATELPPGAVVSYYLVELIPDRPKEVK